MSATSESFWRRCNTCKREIGFGQRYWTCNVSTCNRKGKSYVFCAVDCWQSHVPTMRHRDSWAEEQTSPNRQSWSGQSAPAPARRAVEPRPAVPPPPPAQSVSEPVPAAVTASPEPQTHPPLSTDVPRDILIVASKLKDYVKARSGLNTSDAVMKALSDRVRRLCDDAIHRARDDERKTLLDRDF